ncbi:excalibur calcium-binding domain-containing protein [Asanoa ferruginea]|uniref:Excalibur calcium-binding domain-containing protein n=1 Tax=Asanoa ferruginea TaxID=53367 RepID=A0A3D9Z9Q5_9ACTN|nr:excalibur calcium-binding domain-containing protein [Asanoa ferruginea]REF94138.1 excalibur calcium-binding domain-containing protein [Asanoa ferruginea]GIF52635.1 hypothetical protein Afe04nite_71740 [Asanoa ferruginea]
MSYPQPAAPNWFTRLSPLRRLGAIFGTALVLCLLGAAGFIALLPSGDAAGHRPATLVQPAASGTDRAGATAAPTEAGEPALPQATVAVPGSGPATSRPAPSGPTETAGRAVVEREATATVAPRLGHKPTTGDTSLTDPRFGTCQQARQHHYGPYRRGETEYGWYPDADDDGVVCE